MSFDLKTHIRDPKSGKIIRENHYIRVVKDGKLYYERDGQKFNEDGSIYEEPREEVKGSKKSS